MTNVKWTVVAMRMYHKDGIPTSWTCDASLGAKSDYSKGLVNMTTKREQKGDTIYNYLMTCPKKYPRRNAITLYQAGDNILKMVNDGFDLEDIYERYASIPKHKISHWIRQNGDKNFYKPWTRDEDKALQSLMDGGADRETIGKVMGAFC